MVNKPTIPLRITSGALAGSKFVTSKNVDGSVSFTNRKGEAATVNVPAVSKGTFAVGDGSLPSTSDPVMIAPTAE